MSVNITMQNHGKTKASTGTLPCIEQPVRVTLHCNGYYLWGLPNGRVTARKQRSEKDEFILSYGNGDVVMIQNHKTGGYLSVTQDDKGASRVLCVNCAIEGEEEKEKKDVEENAKNFSIAATERIQLQKDLLLSAEDKNKSNNDSRNKIPTTNGAEEKVKKKAETVEEIDLDGFVNVCVDNRKVDAATNKYRAKDYTVTDTTVEGDDIDICVDKEKVDSTATACIENEDNDEDEKHPNISHMSLNDRQWNFVKSSDGSNSVVLQSLKTGENFGLDATGNLVFTSNCNKMSWQIECATGELCFISNPLLDQRIRCDIAGMTTLSPNWKGWEVFRLMEVGHGYVKISSWMHSKWLLGSTSEGNVNTYSHVDSLLRDNPKGVCCKWAIEKSINGNGVIIRSKTHGRLLSVEDGVLKTYCRENEDEKFLVSKNECTEIMSEYGEIPATEKNKSKSAKILSTQPVQNEYATAVGTPSKNKWWKQIQQDIKGKQDDFSQNLKRMQGNFNNLGSAAGKAAVVSIEEGIVWQLEAAHFQTYYFSNVVKGRQTTSIGPFPLVTSDLRNTDKFQLIREGSVTKIFNSENKQFVACNSDGTISYSDNALDEMTEWIVDKPPYQEGGTVFKSMQHNLYLSHKATGEMTEEEDSLDEWIDNVNESETKKGQIQNLFNKKAKVTTQLYGSKTIGEREVWNLNPCMPRAVSSEKIKTFALGTSIAVGTTIAMPFALAGVGAMLGAMGAEVGIVANVIGLGLAGAEATASMGVIGMTAYLVFRPEDSSLTDEHKNKEMEIEKSWSKRPFSNWRGW